MQSCPELASEAVDYVEANTGNAGLDTSPPPIIVLALDTTADAEQLEALKAAIVEVCNLHNTNAMLMRTRSACLRSVPLPQTCCIGCLGDRMAPACLTCVCRCQKLH